MIQKFKNPFLIFTLYLAIGLARVSKSFDKLPADPGFDRVREVRSEGLAALFNKSLGYLDVSARLGPMVSAHLPLRNSAVVLTATTVLITAGLGVLVFFAICKQIGSFALALTSGAALMLIPAASESTLGNHGSLKWPLIATLSVLASSPRFVERHKIVVISLAILSGLSNPFAIVVLVGIAFDAFVRRRIEWSRHGIFAVPLLVTTLIQFLVWWSSGVGSRIYEDAKFMPWAGMGLFWWWLWLSPPLIALGVIVAMTSLKSKNAAIGTVAYELALLTLAIWGIMQWESGIKDSTAVATCTLSSIALLVAVHSINHSSVRRWFSASVTVILVLLSIPKFSAGWYLKQTPNWSNEISRLVSQCEESESAPQEIVIQTTHIQFSCSEIGDWD